MAFTVTARHNSNAGQTSGQTRATAAATPTANSLFLCFFGAQANNHSTVPSPQTPVGGGYTYTQRATSGVSTAYQWDGTTGFRIAQAFYTAPVGASPSSHTVTVDMWSTTAVGFYSVVCCDVTGHDPGGTPVYYTNGANVNTAGDSVSGTVTMTSTPAVGSLVVVSFYSGADSGGTMATPTIGGQAMTAVVSQTNTGFTLQSVWYRVITGAESNNVITCSDLGQSVGNWTAIATVIPAASGSSPITATPTSITSAETFGSPSVSMTGPITATPTGIASAEAFGTTAYLLPYPFLTSIAGSGNQQYPADQFGDPLLIKGDVIWAFPGNAGRWNGGDWQADITNYLNVRQSQGFNLLMIGALGSTQNGTISDTGATFDGVLPWASGVQGNLNNTYWERVDYIIDQAALRGITVLLNVAYSYDMDNGALDGATNTQYTNYGTNLGNRYKTKVNLIWGVGGDYFDTQVTQLGNLFTAIEATGDTHLKSVQNYPESTSRKDIFNNGTNNTGTTWSDWNFVYSYNVTYDGIEYAYDETSPICVIWGDGHFEQDSSPDRKVMRDLIWWALSSGARGHIYGSEGTWAWGSGASGNLTDTVPNVDLGNYWDIFTSLDGWHKLVPDTNSSFVTAGRGTHAAALSSGGGGGEYNASDPQDQYVTASVAPDGTLAVVYFPVDQTITVNPAEMAGSYTVRWVDPTNGSSSAQTIAGTYSPTGNNALGGPDWLLVFESTGAVTVQPTSIASGEAFGTAVSLAPIAASSTGIPSAEAFGTTTVVKVLTAAPTGIASAEAFGTATITGALTSSSTGIPSAEAFGTAVAVKTLTVLPAAIASAEAFGTPAAGQVLTSAPTAIPSAEAFGTPVAVLAATPTPTAIPSAEAFGTPTAVIPIAAQSTGIPSAEAFGVAVAVVPIAAQPGAIGSGEAFGTATATGALTVGLTGIASAEAFGTPAVTTSLVSGSIAILSAEAFGTPIAVKELTSSSTGITSGEAFGSPVAVLPITAQPTGISSAEAFGDVDVAYGLAAIPDGITSGEAFGTPTAMGALSSSATGIPSEEAFGTSTALVAQSSAAVSIPSQEAFGTPTAIVPQGPVPAGIPSAEAFGTPTAILAQAPVPTGIPSAEAFGTPSVVGAVVIETMGIPSEEAFGTPWAGTVYTVTPEGIASEEAFGFVSGSTVLIVTPTGIVSAEAFGTPQNGADEEPPRTLVTVYGLEGIRFSVEIEGNRFIQQVEEV